MTTVPTTAAPPPGSEVLTQEWYNDAKYDVFTQGLARAIADPSQTTLSRLSEFSLTTDRGSCIAEKKKVMDAASKWSLTVRTKADEQTQTDAAKLLHGSFYDLSLQNTYENKGSRPGQVPFLDRAYAIAAVMNAERSVKACQKALPSEISSATAAAAAE